jgi:hypothetical protein
MILSRSLHLFGIQSVRDDGWLVARPIIAPAFEFGAHPAFPGRRRVRAGIPGIGPKSEK